MQPVYYVRDPELFKQIAVKDFDAFENHRFTFSPEMDSLLGNMIASMRGTRWRKMRSTLSPLFTSSKLRNMFDLIRECAIDARNYILEHKLSGNQNECEMETKDFFARISNNVIASCAFGLKINSLIDRENEFYTTGSRIQSINSLKYFLKIILMRASPWLTKQLNIQYLEADMHAIFTDIIMHNIKSREANDINRPDLIDLLMRVRQARLKKNLTEAKDDDDSNWSDKELVAQALAWLFGGFDTITWAFASTAYELAINPDVQQKLHDEVDSVTESVDGKDISHDDLNKMKYLDMVISEVLRMHAPAVVLDRVCTKEFVLTDGDKVNVTIDEGSQIWIAINNLHFNSTYFPNPHIFDPERFSDENKGNISPSFYAPFGIGPRACLGTTFALMEWKTIMYYLLRDFTINVSSKTEIPMQVKGSLFGLLPRNGLNLLIRRR